MREIKFRAWIRAGAWEEPDEMQQEYVMLYGDELAFEEYAPINELLASVEYLMQHTGLKDSRGNEIYEGDILEIGWMKRAEVKPDGEGYLATEKQYHLRVEMPDIYYWAVRNGFYEDDINIIGNVHENPELLEEGK